MELTAEEIDFIATAMKKQVENLQEYYIKFPNGALALAGFEEAVNLQESIIKKLKLER